MNIDTFDNYQSKLPMVEIQNTCLTNMNDIVQCIADILRKDITGDIEFYKDSECIKNFKQSKKILN